MLRRQNVQQLNLPPPSPTSKGRGPQPSQDDDEWNLRDHLYRAEWGERDPYVMQVWIDPRAHALSARPLAGSWATHTRILPACHLFASRSAPCRVAKKSPRVQGTSTTSMALCWKLTPPGICGVLRDAGCLNKKPPKHSQARLLCPTNLHSARHFMGCWNGCAKGYPPCQLMSWQTCANVCAR